MIQMVNLQAEYQALKPEIDAAMQEVLQSGYFIGGPMVKKFQSEFETYMTVNHVVPCANGTDALQLAFMALNLQPGDEVIIPCFTYVAPAEAALLIGVKPIFVDINKNDFNIDVNKIEEKINSNTKAIVAVHLFGQSADMTEICQLAKKHNLVVIEDNAQATGAKHHGQLTGTFGEFGTTSFFPSKNLGCYGDGGAVLSDDMTLAKKAKQIASHGQSGAKFFHDVVGINSRLDAMQAAILSVKLKRLPQFIENRRKIASRYIDELSMLNEVVLPIAREENVHSYHQFVIRVASDKRDQLRDHLKENGVASGVYYPHILSDLPPYKTTEQFEVSKAMSQEIVAIPIHPFLTEKEQDKVISSIKSFYGG